jgi:hypothetical protein
MNMRKRYLLGLMICALPPAAALAAQHHHVSATVCSKSYGDDYYTSSGAFLNNHGLQRASFGCAVPLTSNSVNPLTVNPSAMRVDYIDNSPINDFFFTGAVVCQLWLTQSNGTTVGGGNKYSCATAGGCTFGDGYVGSGYIDFVDTIGNTANVVGVSVACGLPPYDNTYGPSALLGIAVSTSTP